MSLREVMPGEENLPSCSVCGAMVKGSKCLSCGEPMKGAEMKVKETIAAAEGLLEIDEQRACCAHSQIDYSQEAAGQGVNLAGNPVNLVRDCWKCQACGTEFMPAPCVQWAVDRATKELQAQHNAEDAADYFAVLRRAEAAETALAEAQKDTARLLEWVAEQRAIIYETSSSDPTKQWACYRPGGNYSYGYTLREAIDAAVAESPSKETK